MCKGRLESKIPGKGDSQAEQHHWRGWGGGRLLLLLFIYFKTKLTEMFALNTLMKQDTCCLNPVKSEPRVYAQLPALPLQVQEEQLAEPAGFYSGHSRSANMQEGAAGSYEHTPSIQWGQK